jgi:hypothetical protein
VRKAGPATQETRETDTHDKSKSEVEKIRKPNGNLRVESQMPKSVKIDVGKPPETSLVLNRKNLTYVNVNCRCSDKSPGTGAAHLIRGPRKRGTSGWHERSQATFMQWVPTVLGPTPIALKAGLA